MCMHVYLWQSFLLALIEIIPNEIIHKCVSSFESKSFGFLEAHNIVVTLKSIFTETILIITLVYQIVVHARLFGTLEYL